MISMIRVHCDWPSCPERLHVNYSPSMFYRFKWIFFGPFPGEKHLCHNHRVCSRSQLDAALIEDQISQIGNYQI